jgi:hypothetical protein
VDPPQPQSKIQVEMDNIREAVKASAASIAGLSLSLVDYFPNNFLPF